MPKGCSAKFKRCVGHVMEQGHEASSAYAICTVSVGRGLVDDDGQIRGGLTDELRAEAAKLGPMPARAESGEYICPACATGCVGIACPHCGGMCPPNFCALCGLHLGVEACPACGQPMPALAAKEESMSSEQQGPGGQPARTVSVEQVCSLGAIESTREEALQGIVEAYASAETLDRHGTVIDQDAVLPLLATARVDQQHDKQAIEGITVESVARVKRQLGDKETDSVKTILRFDLAIEAAKRAFEKIRDGTYKGLSIMFRMPGQLAEAIHAGTTNLISQIEDLPFVSLVTAPSCEEAVIDCYRAAPEAKAGPAATDPWAEAKGKLEAVIAGAAAEVRAAEVAQAVDFGARIDEVRAYVDKRFEEIQAKILEILNSQVVGALDAVRTHADTAVRDVEVRLAREVRSQVDRLRVVKPKREIEIGEPDQPTKPAAPAYNPLRFNF